MSLALVMLAGLGCVEPAKEPVRQGAIRDVVVVIKDNTEPLPFDPRGGRLTIVTSELTRLVGHPVVLELDSALSPELKASLEATVLASFETITRELVLLQREDPEMFAKARIIERVFCAYDAVKDDSEGTIDVAKKTLMVRAPADRFPLLEPWVLTRAVYDSFIADLDARWGEADPAKLSPPERAPYFAYMTRSRPGTGNLWIAKRRRARGSSEATEALYDEHLSRILTLARVVQSTSDPLARKIRGYLLGQLQYLNTSREEPTLRQKRLNAYGAWLAKSLPTLDDGERLIVARTLFERSFSCPSCSRSIPNVDTFAFGMGIFDEWVKDGAKLDADGPRGELFKSVLCPSRRRGEDQTEIVWGCGGFFARAIADDELRARLADTITKRHDTKLLETALLDPPKNGGETMVSLVESLRDEALFHHGFEVLFHDLARVDVARSALEAAATRWWRDQPKRRGLALLVMARAHEGLHVHYGDNHWTRFVGEYGGPVKKDVLTAYLAEGPRAVEMTPKIWLALDKSSDRDRLVAKSVPVLLDRDHKARSSRTSATLALLRQRLCRERDDRGMSDVRAAIEEWLRAHPDGAALVSNARVDFTLERCRVAAPKEEEE